MTIFRKKEEADQVDQNNDSDATACQCCNEAQEVKPADEMEKALQSCQQELASLKDRYMRTSADFENYRRRQEKDRLLWVDTAQAAMLSDLLAIVDDVDRANEQLQKQEHTPELEAWFTGIDLISKSLSKVLSKYGVQEMSSYTDFNPEMHEAIAQIESEQHASGAIVQVLQKGFMYKDQVLRPAKVSVAK